jgi:hypothetical protein
LANFITKTKVQSKKTRIKRQNGAVVFLTFAFLLFTLPATAQTIAILTPDRTESSKIFAERLRTHLGEKLKLLDDSLAEVAYMSASPATPFNLTAEESRRISSAIGCDIFILVKSATQRRSSFQRDEYYESNAAIYVVSSRTGRLVLWTMPRFEAAKPDKAEQMLAGSIKSLASEVEVGIRATIKSELTEPDPPALEEVPEENSPASKSFRPPVPYRRIKPVYTAEAALYDITATVDLVVDLSETGLIIRTNIVRWAGFGLDESVEKTVRAMNWRPGERNGKPLPMRFLVRYNFKKIEKD